MRRWLLAFPLLAILTIPGVGLPATRNFSYFDLVYQDRDSGQPSVVADSLSANLSTIQRETGLALQNRITVYLYTTSEYAQHIAGNSHLKNSIAYYSPRERAVHMIYGWTSGRSNAATLNDAVLRHELTHAVLDSYPIFPRPTWFEEGLARFTELGQDGVRAQRERVQQDARRNILTGMSTHEMAPYDIGVVAIDYLLKRYGPTVVYAIMAQQPAVPFDRAFQTVTGITPEMFLESFRQAMR